MKNLINISSLSVVASAIVLSLIFTGCGDTDPEHEGNHLPDVNIIQNNKTVNVGTKVNLTSIASDVDGDALTYEWKFVSKPADSLATLTTSTTKKASFTADKAGKYVVQFIAKDIVDAIGKDTVTITAKKVGDISSSCTSYTEISGQITGDTTYNGCYKVVGDIDVKNNALLTIRPGSTLIFAQGTDLLVGAEGGLKAVGTPTQPILFTGSTKSAGHWDGIWFRNAVDSRNELANVVIEYAGSWLNGAISAGGATKLKIRDSIIRDNKQYGFYFDNKVVLNEFKNVTSTRNEKTAGSVHPNALKVIDGTSDFSGNNNNYLTLRGGTINSDQTWKALNVPLFVKDDITIPSNKFLTIEAGSRFEFASGVDISVYGALKAVGTAEVHDKSTGDTTPAKPILFTGSTKSAGHWDGIWFRNAIDNRNELGYVSVEHTGSWDYAAIYASGATVLNLHDSTIQNNSLFGLWISANARVTNTNNTFANNVEGDVHQEN